MSQTVSEEKPEPIKKAQPSYPLEAMYKQIQGQVVVKMFISERGDVERAEVVSGDPALAGAAKSAAKKWKFKPLLRDGKPVKTSTEIPFNFSFRGTTSDTPLHDDGADVQLAPPPSGEKAEGKPGPLHLGVIEEGRLIHRVQPVYPLSAVKNRISGAVVMTAVIGKDGKIKSLVPISGPPQLIKAAVGAVQQWRYLPYVANGEAVEVETTITVNFTLGG